MSCRVRTRPPSLRYGLKHVANIQNEMTKLSRGLIRCDCFEVKLLVLLECRIVGMEKSKIEGSEGGLALETCRHESKLLESRQHLLVEYSSRGAVGRRASPPGSFAFATERAQLIYIAEGSGTRHFGSRWRLPQWVATESDNNAPQPAIT